jgi:ankyrin repeat protein
MHDPELTNAVLLCDDQSVASILAGDRSRASTIDDQGRTLLMTAVSQGMEASGVSLPVLGALLDAGVDINAQDTEGNTALTLAVGECTTEVLRFLLARGADPNLGRPLIHALWSDATTEEDLQALLAAGADPLAQESDGMNAVEWAEDGGDEDFIRVLKRAARRSRKQDV